MRPAFLLQTVPLSLWLALIGFGFPSIDGAQRTTVSLDGTWEIAEGKMDSVPVTFDHTVIVPGLADLTRPPFRNVGFRSAEREAFWYRRTLKVKGPIPEVALLKIHKACFGTAVFLNGKFVGGHLPSFTPGYFDLRPFLRDEGRDNELVVRVGANRDSLPQDMPTGWDFEKYRFIPGIFDSVELILANRPFVVNVQAAPDPANESLRITAEIDNGATALPIACHLEIVEWRSGRAVAAKDLTVEGAAGKQPQLLDCSMAIPNPHLWTPEDPFLYELRLRTEQDVLRTRFGMRSFGFDPRTKRAILNGKPYYLRGSNITLYRFFEDDSRGDLPWDRDWVRRLHRKLKSMNWNALRYCIGFPPELWYEIADEEGFLIQDEFPIWLLGGQRDHCPEWPLAGKIIPQYTEWMRERWNHPCVAIWDAQNESFTPETGKALSAVRHLDLSHRPWENGWGEPQAATDCVEAHPYLSIGGWAGRPSFHLSQMPKISGVPSLQKSQQRLSTAILINEYGWLWLTREGQPTCLTTKVYEKLLGPEATPNQRRHLYARYLAAKTEFWRVHRECAGVLHFCALGYSRAGDKPRPEGGATSDHWADVKRLKFEPQFEAFLRDAFNPLGIMLDFWEEEVNPGALSPLKVWLINDRETDWEGAVRLRLIQAGKSKSVQSQAARVPALGRVILDFKQALPTETGPAELVAEITDSHGKVIRSRREFTVQRLGSDHLSIGQR